MTSADSINSPSAFQEVFQDFIVVAIPTKTNFRGITIREVALFRGTAGWSEFSPFLEYEKAEAKVWLKAAIEGAYVPWPIALRDSVQINATLPQIDVARVSEILSLFPGCTTIKIKVSDFVHDSEIVEAVLNEIPNAKIRLDVNGGWTLQQALANLHNYQLRFGEVFEYVEQPCSSSADLVELKQRISMKIAADESIRKALNSDLSVIKSFADIAIIKWQPSGGIQAAFELTEKIGLPVVISSALESGIGISHGLALASAISNLPSACGLGTASLLIDDIATPAEIIRNGELKRQLVEPDSGQLHKYKASAQRQLWWQNRIQDIWNDGFSTEVKGWLN